MKKQLIEFAFFVFILLVWHGSVWLYCHFSGREFNDAMLNFLVAVVAIEQAKRLTKDL